MKQFLTILILGALLSSQTAMACCGGEYIGVYPRGSYVSSNSTFLIDFAEDDLTLKNKISDLVFTAVNTNGKRYKLTVLGTNFSGTMGQVFLKVKTKLKIGDTISIQVSSIKGDSLSGKTMKFANVIGYRKWTVHFEADKERPTWTTDSITYSTLDSRDSSAPSYVVIFKTKVNDNSRSNEKNKVNEKASLPFFYLVVLDNQKFICASDNSDMGIFFGMCGSNFNFGIDKTYSATLKAIDASGNYSNNTKTILFTTTGDKDEMMILY
jgi:hypothetical protein